MLSTAFRSGKPRMEGSGRHSRAMMKRQRVARGSTFWRRCYFFAWWNLMVPLSFLRQFCRDGSLLALSPLWLHLSTWLCRASAEQGTQQERAPAPQHRAPGSDLDWADVKATILEYFPLDGTRPRRTMADIQSLHGRQQYKDFYVWYQHQPHLFVSYETHKDPIAVLSLQAFVMYTSNDSERCIQIREHSAMVDLISIPFAAVVKSGWPIFGMLHEVSLQLRSTSGYPLWNFCDSLDAAHADRFLHQLRVFLDEEKDPLLRLERSALGGEKFRSSWGDEATSAGAEMTGVAVLENAVGKLRGLLELADVATSGVDARATTYSGESGPIASTRQLTDEQRQTLAGNLELLEEIRDHSMKQRPIAASSSTGAGAAATGRTTPTAPNKFRVSSLHIYRYLTGSLAPSEREAANATFWQHTWWHMGKCTFGKAAAAFALALMADNEQEQEEMLQEGQKLLLNYNLQDSLYDLISTKWPVWRLLDLIQKRVFTARRIGAALKEVAEVEREIFKVEVASSSPGAAAATVGANKAFASGTERHALLDAKAFAATVRPALSVSKHSSSVYHEEPVSHYFPYFTSFRDRRYVTIVILDSPDNYEAENAALAEWVRRRQSSVTGVVVASGVGNVIEAVKARVIDPDAPALLVSAAMMVIPEDEEQAAVDFLGIALSTALHCLEQEGEVNVVGFPMVVDSDGGTTGGSPQGGGGQHKNVSKFYLWEPRRIRDSHGALQFLPYPTGYARTAGKLCFESEGGHSSTRLFRSGGLLQKTLEKAQLILQDAEKSIFAEPPSRVEQEVEAPAPQTFANLVVATDLALRHDQTPQHLCFNKPVFEKQSYLQLATLPVKEATHFTTENERLHCDKYLKAAETALEKLALPATTATAHARGPAQQSVLAGADEREANKIVVAPLATTASIWCFREVLGVLFGGGDEEAKDRFGIRLEQDDRLPNIRLDDVGLYERRHFSVYLLQAQPSSKTVELQLSLTQTIRLVRHSSAIVQRRFKSASYVRLAPEVLVRILVAESRSVALPASPTAPGALSTRTTAAPSFTFLVCGRTNWLEDSASALATEGSPDGTTARVHFFDEGECAKGFSALAGSADAETDDTPTSTRSSVVLVFARFLFDVRWGFHEMAAQIATAFEKSDLGGAGTLSSKFIRPSNRTDPSSDSFAAFFPIVNPDGEHVDTCRKLRISFWKALYYRGASSSVHGRAPGTTARGAEQCAGGSAFRVYSAKLFAQVAGNRAPPGEPAKGLVSIADSGEKAMPPFAPLSPEQEAVAILTHLDLQLATLLNAQENNPVPSIKVIYPGAIPIPEDEQYALSPILHPHTADQFQVEAVSHLSSTTSTAPKIHTANPAPTSAHNILPPPKLRPEPHVRCMPGLNWFQINTRGVIGSYCFRQQVERHFRYFVDWWVGELKQQAVPEEGSLLALWRNGRIGQFPWDSDFDVKLYTDRSASEYFSEAELGVAASSARGSGSASSLKTIEQEPPKNLTKDGFNELLQQKFARERAEYGRTTQAWSFLGCGDDNYFLIRIPNITHHIGDIYYQHSLPKQNHPWRVRMLGQGEHKISVSQGHMEHIYFDRYHAPVEKLFGDHGSTLQCLSLGHNACLPNCVGRDGRTLKTCEFQDNFVHVDIWDPPESEITFWPRYKLYE